MNMSLLPVFVLFKLLTIFDNVYAAKLFEFTRRSDLNDFVCTSPEIVFIITTTTQHPYHCLQKCAGNSTCLSAFYHQNTGLCVGCSGMYSSSEDPSLGFIEGNPGTQCFEKRACPYGWTGWRQSCYKMTSAYASFQYGVDECGFDHGHAVRIEDTMENEFLQDLFRYKFGSYMYIGTVFDPNSLKWKYHDTGEVAPFTFYASGHGSLYPGDKKCSGFATVHPTRWYNEICTNDRPTLCEINL